MALVDNRKKWTILYGLPKIKYMDESEKVSSVELLSVATQALRESTGLLVRVLEVETLSKYGRADARLRIGFGEQQIEFSAVVKSYVSGSMVGALAGEVRRQTPTGLLVTGHVTGNQAERLRSLGVPFFDTAGNAFINKPPLYVFVSGRRPEVHPSRERTSRAFTASGLKTSFALLCNPGLERMSYREIAAVAGVSHGTVGWVMSDLEKEGFMVDMGERGRRLPKKEELLKRWAEAYPEQLRPKLLLGRYRSKDPAWWSGFSPEHYGAYWGGEVAAAKLTQYLMPEAVTLYADRKLPEVQVKLGWRADTGGDVEVLKKFWEFEYRESPPGVAPPLLVYADLLASADPRNVEVAGIIYDTHLSGLVG